LTYAFDDIGNRKETGGRASAVSTYQPNELNQYTERTVAGAIDVFGLADPQVAVQVNGATASRYGAYFHRVVSVDNSASAQYPTITIQAGNNSATRHAFVPKNPEIFSYDKDGNLTQDGRWTYEWNGENRLVQITTRSDVPGPHYQLSFQYDWMGRRIRKTVVDADTGQTISDLIFLYDGWNLIAEVDAQTGELIGAYVWGPDLSGTFQGAGGISGLLWVNVETGSHAGRYVAAYDGNGNVMGLVSASDGSLVAQYEYGPFAEPLRATGPLAADNPFRFSTKCTDSETGLLYYGYRYYSPTLGRWLSRDPVGVSHSLVKYDSSIPLGHLDDGCLYRWVNNQPNSFVDKDGLRPQVPEPLRRLIKKLPFCLVQCQFGLLFKKIDHWVSSKYFCGHLRRYCQGEANITRSNVLPDEFSDVESTEELQKAIGDTTAFGSCIAECLDFSGRLSIKPYAEYERGWKAWCDHREKTTRFRFRMKIFLNVKVSLNLLGDYEKRLRVGFRFIQGQCKIAYNDCCCD